MRHRKGVKKLGRNGPHRRSTLRNMTTSLFRYERIHTTEAKAKALRPFAERLVTLAKRGDLAARRLAAKQIADAEILQKLFGEIAERCADRPGGYTRVLKTGVRRGDRASTALIELVDRNVAGAAAEPQEVNVE
ncbi:MAG: 50S ribosomal protein L17 [Myxococcales bacterium]|nr:50S ribosomal protein L17 [Myxococcales bacterium]